jgi:mannose-6-phosphate isomerase-like protein (cupin superfamily)
LPGPGAARAIQFLRESYAPGADTGAEPYSHEGEEGGFCVSGSVEVTVAGRRELLGPGDAYYYASKLPHRWRNVGRVPAVVISGCTPPTF